jgi:hypothetical protein
MADEQGEAALWTAKPWPHSAWNEIPRISAALLDDAARRNLRIDQLRELAATWLIERPNDPLPPTVYELEEVLLA